MKKKNIYLDNTNTIAIVNFYSFVNIPRPEELVAKVLLISRKKNIKGTIILATEGFNGSISSFSLQDCLYLVDILKNLTKIKDINIKVNYCVKEVFSKIKVKVKNEVVSMKTGKINIEKLRGNYIDARDWDNFIDKSDVITIDVRNIYEIKIGSFKGAINPNTENFREFPNWAKNNKKLFKGKKIAMFCTGGIRCEKSTSYMKILGYTEIYHLKGGILQYLEDTKNKSGIWKGNCFVFDDRGAIDSSLSPAKGYWVQNGQNAKHTSKTR